MNSPKPTSALLAEQDVREMVHLLADIIALSGVIDEKRRLLMEGLCGIIDAESWVWCLANGHDKSQPLKAINPGEIHEDCFARYLKSIETQLAAQFPHDGHDKSAKPPERTTRGETLYHHLITSCGSEANLGATVGPLMTSVHTDGEKSLSGIGIYRDAGAPPFDERAVRIARILLSEVPWLHSKPSLFGGLREEARLYPRHRMVLKLLCSGWSRKKIALQLGLSLHTVHSYTKTIYAHFGVHSQAELLARFGNQIGGTP